MKNKIEKNKCICNPPTGFFLSAHAMNCKFFIKPMQKPVNLGKPMQENWEKEFEECFINNVRYQVYGSFVDFTALKDFIRKEKQKSFEEGQEAMRIEKSMYGDMIKES